MDLDRIKEKIIAFRDRRDWRQFHDPKNLAAAIAIEAAELQEIFLWQSLEQARETGESRKEEIAGELADILMFTLLLAHEAGIDPGQAVLDKLEINETRYPVEKSRGNSKKYDEL